MTIADSRVVEEACRECGMPCIPNEYHPYAACLMFRGCHNSKVVRENLRPLSLLAEAESRVRNIDYLLEVLGKENDSLQSRLDAVVGLAGELDSATRSGDVTVPQYTRLAGMADELRSAALGGESP